MDFPLHRLVWRNDHKGLKAFLDSYKNVKDIIEKLDTRGRTALLLAIILRRTECVKVLLSYNGNCLAVDKQNFSVLDEAIAAGDPDLLRLVLQHRQYQVLQIANDTVPKVLSKLAGSPDFYVEMSWSFSSWIPFVSHLLPSDTYKVWKSANAVRVDTTLLGFENRKWKRGSLSLVFRLGTSSAEIIEINHTSKTYSVSKVEINSPVAPHTVSVPADEISWRLTHPVMSSYIDVDAICFERAKIGFLGSLMSMGNDVDKMENISGYECKVYNASDVKFISQRRTEHLLSEDKKRRSNMPVSRSVSNNSADGEGRLASLLSAAVQRSVDVEERKDDQASDVTEEQYFNDQFNMDKHFVGRPKEMTTKTQRFHASLWMSDEFPLSLQDQILPIIDLLAQRHSHVKKLREFITIHLPAGFPVKIELPLYYVLTATVVQNNVHATVTPVEGVHTFRDNADKGSSARENRPAYETTFCAIDESIFRIPPQYRKVDAASQRNAGFLSDTVEATIDDEAGNSHFGHRLANTISRSTPSSEPPRPQHEQFAVDEETQMQMALAMSLQDQQPYQQFQMPVPSQQQVSGAGEDSQSDEAVLQAALAASLRESGDPEQSRIAQEEADLAAALTLSLKEQ